MKEEHIRLLSLIALAMVIVVAFLYSGINLSGKAFVSGTPLIQGLDTGTIAKITIQNGDKKVTIERKGGQFVVDEKYQYPASMEQINDLIIKCLDTKLAEKVSENPSLHSDLGVADDSENVVKVSFYDDKDKELIGFLKGKSLQTEGGSYIRLKGKNEVYSTVGSLYINYDPAHYLDTGLFDVKEDDIQSVNVSLKDSSYNINRDDKGKMQLQNVPAGREADSNEYEDVFKALPDIEFKDVMPAEGFDANWDATYECRLKSGLVYLLQTVEKDKKYYLKVSASVSASEGQDPQVARLAAGQAQNFNRSHRPWVYELESWKADNLRTKFDDLLVDKEDKKGTK